MKTKFYLGWFVGVLVGRLLIQSVLAAGSGFTYQGRFSEGGLPANGNYDFKFTLFNSAAGGTQIGGAVAAGNLPISLGQFQVELDFGTNVFLGEDRWVEIAVRPADSTGDYVILNPRQRISPVPYAMFALDGNPGPIGPVGPQGPPGATGLTGPTGPAGQQGPVGPSGPIGPIGAQGSKGETGPAGVSIFWLGSLTTAPSNAVLNQAYYNSGDRAAYVFDGLTWQTLARDGATGPQGPKGEVGATGPAGPAGATGPQGPTGATGLTGLTGPVGQQGPVGPIGPIGPIGPQGLKGETGPAGPAGPQGPQGATGLTGPIGPAGPQGSVGPIGPIGAVGPQGPKGETGLTGPMGPAGAQGPVGPIGPIGPEGPPGSLDAWALTGSVGTDPLLNFLGTADEQPLEIRVNNHLALRIKDTPSGPWIGVNTNAPQATLHVNGNALIEGNLSVSGAFNMQTTSFPSLAINTDTPKPGYQLSVDGRIVCEELLVQNSADWPDYVFADTYPLRPLDELETYIQSQHRLPGIPSAEEVDRDGIPIGVMQKRVMEKIEELTLYSIEQNKRIAEQESRIRALEERLKQLESR